MFEAGDKVFYPMHGAGVIKAIEEKEVLGEDKKYLNIHIPSTHLNVLVPMDHAKKVGLRPLTDPETAQMILERLQFHDETNGSSWKERFRENSERLKTGDFKQIVAAFQDLNSRNKEKPLNTSEKELLNEAQKFLISEICLIKDINEQEAEDLLLA